MNSTVVNSTEESDPRMITLQKHGTVIVFLLLSLSCDTFSLSYIDSYKNLAVLLEPWKVECF